MRFFLFAFFLGMLLFSLSHVLYTTSCISFLKLTVDSACCDTRSSANESCPVYTVPAIKLAKNQNKNPQNYQQKTGAEEKGEKKYKNGEKERLRKKRQNMSLAGLQNKEYMN